jgi:predicted ATPase
VEAIGAVLALGGIRPATRLPIPSTRFIGREQQLWQIRQLLQRTRLLTLTGTGGTGKTRLAIEIAARELDHFPGGVYFVPLAPLSAPEEVPSAIIGTLDIPEVAGMTLEERIAAALGEQPSLLLIDNFEHVLEAAVLVPRLLAAAPALKVLVTSRAALRLSDEVEYTVPPLTQPVQLASPEHLERFESVELFVECARKARPCFELHGADAQVVAEMCRRLDGLPLAIELAAARLKVLAPGDVLARLSDRFALLTSGVRDVPERHRTLRAAMAWSYDLLLPPEKQLFRRLSVFAGGCTLPAAEAVGGLEEAALVDALAALVDHNLVVRSDAAGRPPRFSMLETIREFARDLLKQSGEDADARTAHMRFFLDLAERLAPTLRGGDQARSLAILEAEHANLRVALDLAAQEPPLEARLTIALSTFWLMRGYLAEGRERVARALGRAGLSIGERADLLSAAGTYGHNIGEYREARDLLEEALACHRQTGNERGVADALNHIGWVAWRLASYADAIALSNEALDLQRRLGNDAGIAASLNNLGWTAQYRGEIREAVGYLEEALAIRRRLDNLRATAFAKCNLGGALTNVGRYEEAEALLVEAIDHFRAIGDRQLLGFSCARLAGLHHALGDHQRAVDRLERESIPIFRSIGDRWGLACALAYLGSALAGIGGAERAEEALSESLELRRATDDRHGEADALTRLGELARLEDDAPTAISHFDAALRVLDGIDSRDRVPACLESVALLYNAHGMPGSAAALLAAADQLRSDTGAARPPQQESLLSSLTGCAREEGAPSFFEEAPDLRLPALEGYMPVQARSL